MSLVKTRSIARRNLLLCPLAAKYIIKYDMLLYDVRPDTDRCFDLANVDVF